jgi:tRNA/tmRNA/rRNA uracil-C5-methylase (TrmA/RlmC/RlmD family)
MPDGGWETWEWDETLFAGTASHYVRGRSPYAPGLAEAMTRELGLDGHGRLLDVGCGPGVVALELAGCFEAVVGLDADRGMIDEAARLADERGVTNAAWVHERAEALPAVPSASLPPGGRAARASAGEARFEPRRRESAPRRGRR